MFAIILLAVAVLALDLDHPWMTDMPNLPPLPGAPRSDAPEVVMVAVGYARVEDLDASKVDHARCNRCDRKLTAAASVARSLGPTCARA